MNDVFARASEAADFLKLLGNPNRLAVLCALSEKRFNVSELMRMVGVPQTAMSNQLAKLRDAKLVDFEVNHRERLYYICDERVVQLIKTLHEIFCEG